ncbi:MULTISPECIES: hypothetical protein [Herbaspirillum]|nr:MULTISPECIES: hypothetical protein [Herbaspirillum]UWE19401.1 hypothetical protein NY669_26865 [Herbaspirillum huttiense]|tara:strand:- start:352 stop:492 length:141 start_codon:yes stop_codon:yes gene_type:complete
MSDKPKSEKKESKVRKTFAKLTFLNYVGLAALLLAMLNSVFKSAGH